MMTTAALSFSLENDLTRQEFWLERFPELSIDEAFTASKANSPPAAEATLASVRERIIEEGYFQEQDELLAEFASRMCPSIERCVAMGISPAFLFLFDESWQCFYRQNQFISSLIGEQYKILPDFWVWHVNPENAGIRLATAS